MSGFTINSVAISGNLTRDPELRSLPSGTSVCSLSVAVNDRYKNGQTDQWEDRPNYFDVTIWKGIGEWVAKNLSKGDGVAIQGKLRWRSWEKDGQKRSAVDIVADSIVPVPRNGGGSSSGGRSQSDDVPVDTGDFERAAAGPPGHDEDIPFLWRPECWDDRYPANR